MEPGVSYPARTGIVNAHLAMTSGVARSRITNSPRVSELGRASCNPLSPHDW